MTNTFKLKKGLGRGLSSLIGGTSSTTQTNKVSISSIIIDSSGLSESMIISLCIGSWKILFLFITKKWSINKKYFFNNQYLFLLSE